MSSGIATPTGPSAAAVAMICGAEILGLAGFSIIPALLPQFIEAWPLTNTQAGWLAGIVSAGYMLAVIPLVSLTDRRPARQLYLASSVLSALSCFGMALCDSLLPALGFRALAGVAMAGMYMPGLRALTHGVEGATRARIAAWYTSSFTIGASLSFLFGRVGTLLGWHPRRRRRLDCLDRAAVAYLRKQAHENPKAFMALIGKIVPTTIETDGAPILLEQIVLLALEKREEQAAQPPVIDATPVSEGEADR